MARLDRRLFLQHGARALGLAALVRLSGGWALSPGSGRLRPPGPLREVPGLGLRVPDGFSARIVAQAGRAVAPTGFVWHTDPDGGACFAAPRGGFIYVSNREHTPGGVSALRFDAQGRIIDAYAVLADLRTLRNCGGGPTPWQTWLSAEEYELGVVWECDPFGRAAAQRLPALGTFSHEACAVDPRTHHVYLTEDLPDGRLYRFVPERANVGGRADLTRGRLQVLQAEARQAQLDAPGLHGPVAIRWRDVPQPNPLFGGKLLATPTRAQVPESTAFRGGEGIWQHGGRIYFTTKRDGRVWMLDLGAQTLAVIYDDAQHPQPVLDGVDNIVVTPGGDLVIVEDKDEAQQAVAITVDGAISPLVELVGQHGSEMTGPAFSPDGRHFLFSSQRGPGANAKVGEAGVTYCVSGPWFAA